MGAVCEFESEAPLIEHVLDVSRLNRTLCSWISAPGQIVRTGVAAKVMATELPW